MNVFITGAGSGLGEGLSRRYAVSGATIGLCDRRADLLELLARDIETKGAKAVVYAVDVADTEAMRQAAEQFIVHCGKVDLVIANAGIRIPNRTLQGESEPIAELMRTNIIGVTNTVVPFVPAMVGQGSGVLVAVSSMAGYCGLPWCDAYSASKAAVRVFMDALRINLHGTNVHAMTLCPGFVRTAMTADVPNDMPFLLDCEEAVGIMATAIAARHKTFSFPWQMRWMTALLKYWPEAQIHKLHLRKLNQAVDKPMQEQLESR
jgi:short-subunit dehydrogenase